MNKYILLVSIMLLVNIFAYAQSNKEESKLPEVFNSASITGQWFLSYEHDITEDMNMFRLKRGYFTIKTRLNEQFSVRYTQDITLDKEGEDIGNVEMRLKYLYLMMHPFKSGFFKHSTAEFGMIHRPWLDYEQSVNPYRVQGTMFVERYDLLNSADFGFAVSGLIGGEIDEDYQKNVDKKYPGKYGSYAFGIYNGPGYHAIEKNNNKTLEGRLTLRPVPEFIPGLQFSYAFIYGKANLPGNIADFNMNLFFASQQHRHFTLTAQYLRGKGNSAGTFYLPVIRESYNTTGYSFFGEIKIPNTNFALFGRYDNFEMFIPENSVNRQQNYTASIGGISYRFLMNKLVLDYNCLTLPDGQKEEQMELVLEIKF